MPQGQQYYQAGPQEGGVVAGGQPPPERPRRQGGGPPSPQGGGPPSPFPPPPDLPPLMGGADTRGQFNQGGKGMTLEDDLEALRRDEPWQVRLGRRLWDPERPPPPEWKGGGFGPFDFTRITPPFPDAGPLWPWDLGIGWEGENWEFGGGLQGTMFGRPGGGGGMGGIEEPMRKHSIHPFLRGQWRGDMPFNIPGGWQFDAGATIDNVLNKSDAGFSLNYDLFGGSGAGNTGYM